MKSPNSQFPIPKGAPGARLPWALGVGVLGAIVLAGCASEPPPSRAASRRAADITLNRDTELIRGLVPRHTTLDALLRANGVAAATVVRVIEAARSAFEPRRLRASH